MATWKGAVKFYAGQEGASGENQSREHRKERRMHRHYGTPKKKGKWAITPLRTSLGDGGNFGQKIEQQER